MVNNTSWYSDDTIPLKQSTQMMYKMFWPIAVKFPADVSENNGKISNGNRDFANGQCCRI